MKSLQRICIRFSAPPFYLVFVQRVSSPKRTLLHHHFSKMNRIRERECKIKDRNPKTGKTSWSELAGKEGECAVIKIEKENKMVKAQIILEGTAIPEIFKCDRVLVWVNENGTVSGIPKVG